MRLLLALSLALRGAGGLSVVATTGGGTAEQHEAAPLRAWHLGQPQLSALACSPGVLRPPFNGSRLTYSVALPADVTALKLTASAVGRAAGQADGPAMSIGIQGAASRPMVQGSALAVPLSAWGNTTLVLTLRDASTTTYTITAAKPPIPDATLKSLQVKGATACPAGCGLSPPFKPATSNYSVSEGAEQATVEVLAVPNSSSAQVKINGKALDSKGQVPPIPIAPVRKSQTTPCSSQTEKKESIACGGPEVCGRQGRNTSVVISVLAKRSTGPSVNKLYYINVTRAWNHMADASLKMLAVDAERRRDGLDCATMSPPFTPLRNFYTVDEVRNLSLLLSFFTCAKSKWAEKILHVVFRHDSIVSRAPRTSLLGLCLSKGVRGRPAGAERDEGQDNPRAQPERLDGAGGQESSALQGWGVVAGRGLGAKTCAAKPPQPGRVTAA